ncbi:MAG: stage III sporulation protein AB [Oscillospiraceae bacterium]
MKIFGSLMLIFACTLFGLSYAKKLRERQNCLAEILQSLRFMEAELKNSATPLPELFRELSETSKHEAREFYAALSASMENLGEESLANLWQSCVMESGRLPLSEMQKKELCRPGLALGRYAGDEQLTAIQSCIIHLEPELQRAEEKARTGLRLYAGLGLTAGLMLATVLI